MSLCGVEYALLYVGAGGRGGSEQEEKIFKTERKNDAMSAGWVAQTCCRPPGPLKSVAFYTWLVAAMRGLWHDCLNLR